MVLKGLLEDGFLLLGDGRRVVAAHDGQIGEAGEEEGIVRVHPAFRMIALANRPGGFIGFWRLGGLGRVCVCVVGLTTDRPTNLINSPKKPKKNTRLPFPRQRLL